MIKNNCQYLKLRYLHLKNTVEAIEKKVTKKELEAMVKEYEKKGGKMPLKDRWGKFQENNSQYAKKLFDIRKAVVEFTITKIKNDLKPFLPFGVVFIEIQNFGSTKVTSDIDLNVLFGLCLSLILETKKNKEKFEDGCNKFFDKLITAFKDANKEIANIFGIRGDEFHTVSVLLDINFYPNSAIFKIIGPIPEVTGIAVYKVNDGKTYTYNNQRYQECHIACFIPILENNDEAIKGWNNNQMDLMTFNRKIKTADPNVREYLKVFLNGENKDKHKNLQPCYKTHNNSVSTCLTKMFTLLNLVDSQIQEWNNLYCCLVGTNRIGSELYFTPSSIIFVVFYLQITKEHSIDKLKIPEHVFQAILLPACLEQLIFDVFHRDKQNPNPITKEDLKKHKYLKRAMKAYYLMDKQTQDYLCEIIKVIPELSRYKLLCNFV